MVAQKKITTTEIFIFFFFIFHSHAHAKKKTETLLTFHHCKAKLSKQSK